MTSAPETSAEDLAGAVQPGDVLGRYELLMPIAAGGMAQVWAARMKGARQFQKIVAVKTMLPELSEDEQFEQMFLDEASLASQIRHPSVVEINDLGEQHGVLYLVMEWIEGIPLNQLMKAAKGRGGVPTPVATRIAMQVCAGLHAAHELTNDRGELVGLVHRDVSPQNILVTYDGVTKVVDFGVAKATALGGGATVAGQVKGKVGYMAPEQIKGDKLDRRVDVFAVGIVLYALTTGKHPFRRESEAATMYNICSPQAVMQPTKVVPDYPAPLEPILLKALAKDPAERYPNCDALLRALDGLPAKLRASSDADVAKFVRDLFGDKRAEKKAQLDDAIQRADEQRPRGVAVATLGEASGSLTGPGRPSLTTLSGNQELSGIPQMPPSNRSKWIGFAGLGALAVSGGVLFQAVVGKNAAPEVAPQPANQVIEAPSVPDPTPPPEETKTPEEEDEAVNALDLTDAEESSGDEKAEAAKTEKKAPAKAKVTSTPAPAPKPDPAPAPKSTKKSWKFEAGF